MDLFQRLGKVLDSAKVKRAEFALTTGMGGDRLDNLINGKAKKLRVEEAQAIRQNYNFSELWLLSGKGPERVPDSEKKVLKVMDQLRPIALEVTLHDLNADQANFLNSTLYLHRSKNSVELKRFLESHLNGSLDSNDYVLAPRHNVHASAGGGSIISDESVVNHLAFKREWITQSLGCQPDKICVIEVRGDSMTPTINDADLLLLDLRMARQKTEGVYVIQFQGGLLVKRLRYKINGTVEVISDNARYPTETLTHKEAEDLQVLGRVVWHGCKF